MSVDKTSGTSADGDDSAPYPSAAMGWTAVAVLFALYVLSFLDRNIMTLLIVEVQKDLEATDFQMGLLYGPAFALLFAVAGLPFGYLIDRYPRRRVIWAGVSLWSLATICCGLSRTFGAMFASRAGVGAGEAVLVPGAQSVVSDMFPSHRLALPLSIYGLGAKVGGGMSLMLGGFLTLLFPVAMLYDLGPLGTMKGWHLIFIVAGLPGLLLACLIFAIPEPLRRHRSGAGKASYREYVAHFLANRRFFLSHHIGQGFVVAVAAAVAAWTPAFFQRVHGWSAGEVGHWLGLSIIAGALLGLPLHGWVSDRLFRAGIVDGSIRYLMAVWALSLPVGIAAFMISDPWIALGFFTVYYFLTSSCTSLPHAAMQLVISGDLRGKAASVLLLFNGVGALSLGPLIAGSLTDFVFRDPQQVGLSLVTTLVVLTPIGVGVLAWALKPMRETLGSPAPSTAELWTPLAEDDSARRIPT